MGKFTGDDQPGDRQVQQKPGEGNDVRRQLAEAQPMEDSGQGRRRAAEELFHNFATIISHRRRFAACGACSRAVQVQKHREHFRLN